MLRRSERLQSMGCYNREGEPIISYKETLYRLVLIYMFFFVIHWHICMFYNDNPFVLPCTFFSHVILFVLCRIFKRRRLRPRPGPDTADHDDVDSDYTIVSDSSRGLFGATKALGLLVLVLALCFGKWSPSTNSYSLSSSTMCFSSGLSVSSYFVFLFTHQDWFSVLEGPKLTFPPRSWVRYEKHMKLII